MKCKECNGKGSFWGYITLRDTGRITCKDCNGTGEIITMKITLLQEQERRLEMLENIVKYIDDYSLELTYPSQIEEFKDKLKDLFTASISHMNASVKICLLKNIVEDLRASQKGLKNHSIGSENVEN